MKHAGKVIILGSGTSTGVPVIGCECRVCRSADRRDKRTRSSALVTVGGFNIIIDTSVDFRAQILDNRVKRLDAILFTHCHADHVFGLDDVRRFCQLQRGRLPCYGDAGTIDHLERIFDYTLREPPPGGGVPRLEMTAVDGPFKTGPVEVTPVPVWHGPQRILGYRIGRFAYLSDVSRIDDEGLRLLSGVETVVIDGLRPEPHPTHFSFGQAVDAAARIGARRAYLTHISHNAAHAEIDENTPEWVSPAYDGLVIPI